MDVRVEASVPQKQRLRLDSRPEGQHEVGAKFEPIYSNVGSPQIALKKTSGRPEALNRRDTERLHASENHDKHPKIMTERCTDARKPPW